jgi:hypothetical protein
MERGVTRIGVPDLSQFARILGKPIPYFYGEEAPAPPTRDLVYGRGDIPSLEGFKKRVQEELDRQKRLGAQSRDE